MAIIFMNDSICSICGEKLKRYEGIFSFPSFVQNTKDPFFQFNDTSFHTKCLLSNPLGIRAIKFAKEFTFKTQPENRRCSVGGNTISKFDDYIFIDMLTSNEREALSKFNFMTLDRNNIQMWNDKRKFIDTGEKFIENGKWGNFKTYNYLENLLEELKSAN